MADKKIERQNPDEMEFKQFYTKKVVINGTLVLGNVRRDKENESKIIIGDEEFKENEIRENYLLKNEEQVRSSQNLKIMEDVNDFQFLEFPISGNI